MSPEIETLLIEARAVPILQVCRERGWRVNQVAANEYAGPCPRCGGTDRFNFSTVKNIWQCRKCEGGGDVVSLVQHVDGVGLVAALETLTGRRPEQPVDPKIAADRRRKAEAEAKRQAEYAERKREQARRDGYAIWRAGQAPGHFVKAYLSRRGLTSASFDQMLFEGRVPLKEAPSLAYRHKVDGEWRTLHEGPAMLAPVVRPDGTFGAVHMTWIDLDQPKGKLVLADPADPEKTLPAKKLRGSKRGGAIRLFTPESPRRLIMGEGIETTGTPLAHMLEPGSAYWAGVDLGHMTGKVMRRDGRVLFDEPDMSDQECFAVPDWCEEFIALTDDDDARTHTDERVRAALKRAQRQRPGILAWQMPPLGGGRDINDLVRP